MAQPSNGDELIVIGVLARCGYLILKWVWRVGIVEAILIIAINAIMIYIGLPTLQLGWGLHEAFVGLFIGRH
jgi:hypothetical protein